MHSLQRTFFANSTLRPRKFLSLHVPFLANPEPPLKRTQAPTEYDKVLFNYTPMDCGPFFKHGVSQFSVPCQSSKQIYYYHFKITIVCK